MKRIFMCLVLALALCSIIASNTWAGEREDNLVNMAGSGNIDGVRALLDQGVDVNAKASTGFTALVAASWFGQTDVVRFLLERGADINKVGGLGHTPLTMAAISGYPDIVRVLIGKGADVNAKGDFNNTALMEANGVLEKGKFSGLDKSQHMVYTPLTPAERKKYEEIVRMLKAAGAK